MLLRRGEERLITFFPAVRGEKEIKEGNMNVLRSGGAEKSISYQYNGTCRDCTLTEARGAYAPDGLQVPNLSP